VAVIITEWSVFKDIDLVALKRVMRTPRMADLRNIFERSPMEAMGYAYDCIGRPKTRSRVPFGNFVLETV
jgi:UDPglucose 6-dehydrogenase